MLLTVGARPLSRRGIWTAGQSRHQAPLRAGYGRVTNSATGNAAKAKSILENWFEYNSQYFVGWPTQSNAYDTGQPSGTNNGPGSGSDEVVALHLSPR
ncbi:MAG TPA: hypothetical protein VMF65_04685 [Acidimicrobiales bacterium]|nr:hypothetical protein [Acidimicrobiales bacterium]